MLWVTHHWSLVSGQKAKKPIVLLYAKPRLTIGEAQLALILRRRQHCWKVRPMKERAVTPGQARVVRRVHPLDVSVPNRVTLARAEEHWYWALRSTFKR